ncbi:MAG: phage tail protein [Solirubrobacteraceae bacterium]
MSDGTGITNGDDETPGLFQTFIGSGFGTVQIERAVGTDAAPPAVSGRRYLRDNLPGIYNEGDFGMRLVSGFEALLDPLVAALDNLPEHFDPAYAPRDVLDLLTEWLGLEHDEARSGEERRQIVRMAPELMRRRGTKGGLELALALAFPGVPFRVEDAGGVTWSLDVDAEEPAAAPSFVVYCDTPLSPARSGAVARLIDQAKPAHVSYRLRVKAPPRQSGGAA